MKSLPAVGTEPCIQYSGKSIKVKVVAHHQEYAVVVFTMNSGLQTSALRKTEDFEIVANEPEQDTCPPGQHHYVQIHEAHQNKAFCTNCGKKISLE